MVSNRLQVNIVLIVVSQIGSQWISDTCEELYTCTSSKGVSTIDQQQYKCKANEACALLNGEYGCTVGKTL